VTWTLVADNLAVLDRELFGAAVLDDKLWISGGFNGFSLNDVWSSTDGISWNAVPAVAPFPIRNGHQMLSHAGKLWVIGGIGNGALSDVWSSPDGMTWTPASATAAFGDRYLSSSVSYGGALLLIGGVRNNINQNDIWSSEDGANWKKGYHATFDFAQP
jgi:hypothetical protein